MLHCVETTMATMF